MPPHCHCGVFASLASANLARRLHQSSRWLGAAKVADAIRLQSLETFMFQNYPIQPPGTTEPQGESTRRAILTFLKVHGGSEVKGIAEFCGLTAMAVRRHLLNFLANGLLQTRTQRRPQGRPVKIYFLTELGDAQFPRDYAGFASDLLSTLVVLDGEAKVKKVFRRRRSSMMIRYKARVKGKSVEERVCETAAILTECGYMAEAAPSESRAFSHRWRLRTWRDDSTNPPAGWGQPRWLMRSDSRV